MLCPVKNILDKQVAKIQTPHKLRTLNAIFYPSSHTMILGSFKFQLRLVLAIFAVPALVALRPGGTGIYFNLLFTVCETFNNRRQITKIVKRTPVYQLRNWRLAIALCEKRKWYACTICGFCIHLAITDIKPAAVR